MHLLCRRLAWIYSLGTAILKGNFDQRPIDMTMSTMQAAVCLLFNDATELTYREVQVRAQPECSGPLPLF